MPAEDGQNQAYSSINIFGNLNQIVMGGPSLGVMVYDLIRDAISIKLILLIM